MDRVFLDANVLFAAAYGSAGLERLWRTLPARNWILLASEYVIGEAERNLKTQAQRQRLHILLQDVEVVSEGPGDIPCPIELPPKDQPVLTAAVAAGATHLLTGDEQHFGRHFGQTVQGLRILRPATYLADAGHEKA